VYAPVQADLFESIVLVDRLKTLFRALAWQYWWPAVKTGFGVLAVFTLAIWLTRYFSAPIHSGLSEHALLGLTVFFLTSVVAVLVPVLSNLALVPAFVLVWGPWWTALILLSGWVVGAALSFSLGRSARVQILRHFPSVTRHAQIDRLIHPHYRLTSLVLLRMTFPVDVLSYALGLFSARTTLLENLVSTVLGAAPFAVVFAMLPTLSGNAQIVAVLVSLLVFIAYAFWILERPADSSRCGSKDESG